MAKKVSATMAEKQMVELMLASLDKIYSDKNSEEYKTKGDITKLRIYKDLDRMITDLKTLKKFPSQYAKDIRTTFDELHRPVWRTNVEKYIRKPDEENALYTALYTVGVRVTIDEISRIYSSTKVTKDGGIEFNPDKLMKRDDLREFFAAFNVSLEKYIDDYIKKHGSEVTQEAAFATSAAGLFLKGFFSKTLLKWIANSFVQNVLTAIKTSFYNIKRLNPVTLVNAFLIRKYDNIEAAFNKTLANYAATKEAYEEYMRLPEGKRNATVVANYEKDLKRIQNSIDNQWAKIEHFNQRAKEDATEAAASTEISEKNPDASSSSSSSSSSDDDGFDF